MTISQTYRIKNELYNFNFNEKSEQYWADDSEVCNLIIANSNSITCQIMDYIIIFLCFLINFT